MSEQGGILRQIKRRPELNPPSHQPFFILTQGWVLPNRGVDICVRRRSFVPSLDRDERAPERPGSRWACHLQRRAVDEAIEAHVAEPLSPVRLAALVRLSPRHSPRAFKQSFSLPPHQYHLARRVDRAQELLRKGEMSITEVAMVFASQE